MHDWAILMKIGPRVLQEAQVRDQRQLTDPRPTQYQPKKPPSAAHLMYIYICTLKERKHEETRRKREEESQFSWVSQVWQGITSKSQESRCSSDPRQARTKSNTQKERIYKNPIVSTHFKKFEGFDEGNFGTAMLLMFQD